MSSRLFSARVFFVSGLWALFLGLGACQQPLHKNSAASRTDSDPNTMVNIAVDWGLGAISTTGGFSQTDGYIDLTTGYMGFLCFENNNACVRASQDVRNVVGNDPVAIQGFALNLSAPTGTSVNIVAASVTTSELLFDVDSGRLLLGPQVTRNLIGSGCDLNAANSVGLAPDPTGQIMTALYLMDEGTPKNNSANSSFKSENGYYNGYMTAARVWYSGLVPASGSDGKPFHFAFVPQDAATVADFGKNGTFEERPVSGSGLYYVPQVQSGGSVSYLHFEADANDASVSNPYNHVVVGFCINGTKTRGSETRPAFLGARVRTYAPQLVIAN
jgi:hypothetical protein